MAGRRLSPTHHLRKSLRNRESSYHPQHDSYKWWILANVMIGTFMAVLDSTIVNVGLPKIMASFGVGLDKIEWVVTAYMLALAVALPTSGWLSDRFGYKRMYFLGMMLFTMGSFLCGISENENILILSRVIQGLGAGTIMPLGMAIVTREFPPEQRGIAIGFWSISAAASVSFGPLIGGYLVDNFSWQLIFDVNVPVGIIGLIATIIIQQEYKSPRKRSFDYVGFLSVSIFLPFVLYALTEGNASTNTSGWHAPYILACFAISAIALAVFLTAELTVKDPLIDLSLLKNYNFGLTNIIMFIFSVGMFGSTFLLPLYLQNSLGYTALMSGAVFLPVGIIQGFMAPVSGMLSNKINPKIIVMIGIFLLALSFYLNSFLSPLTEHNYIMLSLYLRGFAMGVLFTSLSTMSLLDIPRDKMAQASGLMNIIRQLGGSFGVAILATLLSSRVSYHTEIYGESVQQNSEVYQSIKARTSYYMQHEAGISGVRAGQLNTSLITSQVSKEAYIEGINDDFLVAGLITLVGGIPVLFLRTKRKEKQSSKPEEIPLAE